MAKAIPEPITRLIDAFSQLPGVGPKTASRLTYYLLRQPDEITLRLSDALRDLKTHTRLCSICFNITIDDPCGICADASRDAHTIAVVEEPLDVLALERTGSYMGVYHVLHGAISPVHGIGPDDLKIRELVARAEKGINEVIIATNPGMEGDATAMYIQRELANLKGGNAAAVNGNPPNAPAGNGAVKLTRLARGLPVGGDIEYADTVTLMRALQGRSPM